ncbi:MAG: chemotaxis protein CheA [Pseudomonadota bacterium]
MNTQEKHVQTYLEEARELLAELEDAVLELEDEPGNTELINRVFRAMHTIKGSGAMFGFDRVAAFTHHVETVLDQARNGAIPVTRDMTGLILAARDEIGELLFGDDKGSGREQNRQGIIDALQGLLPQERESDLQDREREPPPAPLLQKDGTTDSSGNVPESTYRIRFVPGLDVFRFGIDPLAILQELNGLGRLWVTAITDRIPHLEDLDVENCYSAWDMTLVTSAGTNAIKDVFIFVEDTSEITIEKINSASRQDVPPERLGEILVARGDVVPGAVETAAKSQKRLGELLAESGVVTREKIDSALVEQKVARRQAEKHGSTSVRVAAEKLEQLINIVGELVTTQAQLSQATSSIVNAELSNAVERVEHLTNELRDCVLGVRMLPVGSTFTRFKRLVRDLSSGLGKEVDFITEGDDTELDKTMIEKINDPLVHLIRNSLDHGIELPEDRARSGKPRRGMVRLSAEHAGGEVVLSVEDDGKGLDPEVIARKALEKGLIADAKGLSETEILNLVFQPGFSTASVVTDVSGRGVGMDVVRREIEALRGTVDIHSRPGRGTTVTVRLPLTLAIIDGLLIESGGERYVIPLHHVKECIELKREDVARSHGRHIVDFRGTILPYIRLNEFFGIEQKEDFTIEQIIVVEMENAVTGLVADRIIGEKQAVIKPLGRVFKDAQGLSGATILGDGTVALILDVPQLARTAEREAVEMIR